MPTAKGFTGQRADASTSGLDYYGARYYDPVIGQFASADTKEGPNRFGYVGGNPETLVDPTGHRCATVVGEYCGGHGGGGGGKNPPPSGNPPPGGGNGTGDGDHLTGFLGWLQLELQYLGYDLTATGLANSFAKDNNADVISYLKGVISSLLSHNHAAKDPGRFTRRLADMDGAEAFDEMLGFLGKVLVGIGFVADMATEMISFFNGNSRPDLQGAARLYAAFFAGFVHATISTVVAVGTVVGVDVFTDGIGAVGNFIRGAIGAVGGGFLADALTPGIVDMFVPGGPQPVAPVPNPSDYCAVACT